MKLFKNGIITIGALLLASSSSLALSPEVTEAVAADTPIYKQLGVSSTTMFMIMTAVTVLLLAIVLTLGGVIKKLIKIEQEKLKNAAKVLILGALFFSPNAASAATETGESLISFSDTNFWMFITLDVILILIIFYFRSIINSFMPDGIKRKSPLLAKIGKSLTGEVIEMEEEGSILMDHEYDGIHELDNDLPPWWKYGFYVTIVWGVIYFSYYQIAGVGLTQHEEFIAEMEEGEREVEAYKAAHPELINADNVEQLTDAGSLSQGKEIFGTYCVSCHAEGGIGGIGPNLTDKYWLYDGDIKGIFTSVSEGRANGMVAWKEFIGPVEIQKVASYIMSLEEVNAPQGKEPQGENIFE